MSDLIHAAKAEKLTDQNDGRWLLLTFSNVSSVFASSHLIIALDYNPELGAVETGDRGDCVAFMVDFAHKNTRMVDAARYVDSRGVSWAHARKHGFFKDNYYAATAGYMNGLAVYSLTDSGWKSEINAVGLAPNPGAATPQPKPPAPPDVSDPAGGGASGGPVVNSAGNATIPLIAPPVTDDDLHALAATAKFINAAPLDLLAVLHAESGLKTTAAARDKNGAPIALGLNQLTLGGGARSLGMTAEQWAAIPTMSFKEQLGLVQRFFQKNTHARLSNATIIEQTNFAPATVGQGNVLFRSPSLAYENNSKLDVQKKGCISVDDLTAFLQRRSDTDSFRTYLARMNALGYPGNPTFADGGSIMPLLVVAGLGGGLLYLAMRDSKPSKGAVHPPRDMAGMLRGQLL